MDIPPSVNAMLNGNVDAALVAGSDVLRAQKAGAHIIISGKALLTPRSSSPHAEI